MESIGRYRIVRELGRGGMGVVYEALDPVIDRAVALKTIRNSDGLSDRVYAELRERFLREARAAGKLHHPNVTAVLDAGTDPATEISFIAMELVRGRDLESVLQEGRRFTTAEAAALVAAVAGALDAAHAQGIVHRDVKPANLLLDAEGRVKITDFGIAHVAESGMTRTGQVIGSPAYMSPEQIAGSPVDGRSDIFSLAVVLYRLLTGERPFLGEGLSTLSYQIIHTEPIPARKINPALPASFELILARALAKNPADRYQRARDLAADLVGDTSLGATGIGQAVAPVRAATGTLVAAAAAPLTAPGGTLLEAPVATGTATARAPVPASLAPAPAASTPADRSRRVLVVLIAVALLALAAGLGFSRRTAPTVPQSRGPATAPTATGTRATVPEPPRERAPEPAPRNESGTASVHIDCQHFLGSGTVTLLVDGETVWSSQLQARKETKLKIPLLKKGPRIKMSEERLETDIEVPAGRRTITVRMQSREAEVDDSDSKVANLRAGGKSVWRIRINRITRKVSLDLTP